MLRQALAIALGVIVLSGCVTAPQAPRPTTSSSLRCDEAVGQAVSFGRGQARVIAERSARQQVSDVRGYLLGTGISRVRPAGSEVTCRPYALGGGLTQCVAVLRFCGR